MNNLVLLTEVYGDDEGFGYDDGGAEGQTELGRAVEHAHGHTALGTVQGHASAKIAKRFTIKISL